MMQILKGTPATMELKVYSSGDLTDLDASPTLVVTDANGDAVSSGAVSTPETGVYRSVLAGQSDLKTLKAVWTGALSGDAVSFTQQYEIVGSFLFTEAQARAKTVTGQQTPLSDETLYPDAEIARVREELTRQFEEITTTSWIRRYCRMELSGTGGRVLSLSDGVARTVDGETAGGAGRFSNIGEIISATVGGTAVDVADLRIDGTNIIHTAGTWSLGTAVDPFNVVIEYAYGHDPVPLEAQDNGLREAIKRLVPSDLPSYAQTYSSGDGSSSSYPMGGFVWLPRTFQWLKRHTPVFVA